MSVLLCLAVFLEMSLLLLLFLIFFLFLVNLFRLCNYVFHSWLVISSKGVRSPLFNCVFGGCFVVVVVAAVVFDFVVVVVNLFNLCNCVFHSELVITRKSVRLSFFLWIFEGCFCKFCFVCVTAFFHSQLITCSKYDRFSLFGCVSGGCSCKFVSFLFMCCPSRRPRSGTMCVQSHKHWRCFEGNLGEGAERVWAFPSAAVPC